MYILYCTCIFFTWMKATVHWMIAKLSFLCASLLRLRVYCWGSFVFQNCQWVSDLKVTMHSTMGYKNLTHENDFVYTCKVTGYLLAKSTVYCHLLFCGHLHLDEWELLSIYTYMWVAREVWFDVEFVSSIIPNFERPPAIKEWPLSVCEIMSITNVILSNFWSLHAQCVVWRVVGDMPMVWI